MLMWRMHVVQGKMANAAKSNTNEATVAIANACCQNGAQVRQNAATIAQIDVEVQNAGIISKVALQRGAEHF